MTKRAVPALIILLAVFATIAPLRAAHADSSTSNPSDAFLASPATTVDALVAQVQSNPTICRNYAHYLRIPAARVADYLKNNLVRSRLTATTKYTVYLVHPNGLIYPTMITLPKGSYVFARRNGAPLMTDREGDPMKRFHTAVEVHYASRPSGPRTKVSPETILLRTVPCTVETTIETTTVTTPTFNAPSELTPAEQATK